MASLSSNVPLKECGHPEDIICSCCNHSSFPVPNKATPPTLASQSPADEDICSKCETVICACTQPSDGPISDDRTRLSPAEHQAILNSIRLLTIPSGSFTDVDYVKKAGCDCKNKDGICRHKH